MPQRAEVEARLAETWAPAQGFPGALAEVNNQIIGARFMATAFFFFLVGGVLALLMRLQLAVPRNDLLGPDQFNALFTMHGSTMMFLFAVPFLEGLALYLLPLMLGARDVAFPRLTAYGYWVYLFGGIVFYTSFLFGAVPDIGWFGYTPLSTAQFTGISTDFWLLGLSLVEVAGLTAGVEIVVTILKFRAPGMTLARLPLFLWSMLVVGIMILVAFTVLLTATVLLELDRALDTAFFDVARGGNNLLWQHLFWFFGHPEVYIMFLPAAGIISMIVPTFAQKPISGYVLIVAAIVVTGFVSFGLWVHHMFAAGLPALSMTFFTASSLMIAIASGIQVFAWIATLWGSGPRLTVPLWYGLGFMFLFVLGGMTGVMVAVVPFDLQVHDTYFVVAHFHYVLIGGVVFPIFAGLYFWLPKMTGRMLNPVLGQISFWLTFLGFNLTFFPMHIMGFLGLPRRVYTYPETLELGGYNLASTIGAFALGMGAVVFVLDWLWSRMWGRPAGANPWKGDSLEWSVASPPPSYSFFGPVQVLGRHPLWEDRPEPPDNEAAESDNLARLLEKLQGEPQTWRGNLVTDATDTVPQAIQYLPGPTFLPLMAAVGTVIAAIGVLSKAYLVAAFGVLFLIAFLVQWTIPSRRILAQLEASDLPQATGLSVMPTGRQSTVWWGMVGLLVMYASSFGALFYSYFYIRLFSEAWPQGDLPRPALLMPGAVLALLLLAGACQAWSTRQFQRPQSVLTRIGLGVTVAAWAAYFVGQCFLLWQTEFGPQTNAYASLYYVLSGAVLLLTFISLMLLGMAKWRLNRVRDAFHDSLTLHLQLAALQSGATGVAAVLVFVVLYVSPYLW